MSACAEFEAAVGRLADAHPEWRGKITILPCGHAGEGEHAQLLSALSKLLPAHLSCHEDDGWEGAWQWAVCVHLPAGQALWHIHESDLAAFTHLRVEPWHWDGHMAPERRRRLASLAPSGKMDEQ